MKLPVIVGIGIAVALAVVGVAWSLGALGGDEKVAEAPAGATALEAIPEGVYRYRLTKDDVLALVATLDPGLLEEAIGTFTWTLRDGTISLEQTDCQCSLGRVAGRYTATPSQLTVQWPAKAENGEEFCSGNCVETVDWRFDGKALHITPTSPERLELVFWGGRRPWVKIG